MIHVLPVCFWYIIINPNSSFCTVRLIRQTLMKKKTNIQNNHRLHNHHIHNHHHHHLTNSYLYCQLAVLYQYWISEWISNRISVISSMVVTTVVVVVVLYEIWRTLWFGQYLACRVPHEAVMSFPMQHAQLVADLSGLKPLKSNCQRRESGRKFIDEQILKSILRQPFLNA